MMDKLQSSIKGQLINGEIYILLSDVNKEIKMIQDKKEKEMKEKFEKIIKDCPYIDDFQTDKIIEQIKEMK